MSELPGDPGPTLIDIWSALSDEERDAFVPHLVGSTSADWLADVLRTHGHTISASSIRTYRRSLRLKGK